MKPILVLQMQRMGDLILSFPLFLWLFRTYPGVPVWTVAEKVFFRDLMPVSPEVVYIPWDNYDFILKKKFFLVINLSHRREAAWLTGKVDAEKKIGPYLDENGCRYIAGKWQLYRASLVHNNRHNRFHWADLNALDVVPYEVIQKTIWPGPRGLPRTEKKVGLFLGASEKSKRPSSRFWAMLARQLIKEGFRPVLLGGTLEKDLAERVKSVLGINLLDLTGKLTLSQLAKIGQTLQLLVTPDTGPMHLAAWTGLRVLNLSMGPVNPWETGPYQPGHIVTSARISCSFCWQCKFNVALCKSKFHPRKINGLVIQLIRGNDIEEINGLRLYVSGRKEGLYHLASYPLLRTSYFDSVPHLLNDLWYYFWGYYFGLWNEEKVIDIAKKLQNEYDLIHQRFVRYVSLLLHKINRLIKSNQVVSVDFWGCFPPMLRPITSYLQVFWQNCDFSAQSFKDSLQLLEKVYAVACKK